MYPNNKSVTNLSKKGDEEGKRIILNYGIRLIRIEIQNE